MKENEAQYSYMTNGFKSIYDNSMSNVELVDWIITLCREDGNESRIANAASILKKRLSL